MNIFLIPSWYPTKESPMTGRFFKEQALVYAQEYPYDNIIVSRWGQGEFIIDLSSPIKAIKKFFLYKKALYCEYKLSHNVLEFYSPAIEIRPRKFTGGITSIIQKNRENFKKAKQQYGKIDIIHAHVAFPAGFIAMKLSEQFHIPYVITEHMGPFPFPFFLNQKQQLNSQLTMVYQKASKVIAVSEFLKNEMTLYGVDVHEIIPNIVDDDFFAPNLTCKDTSSFTILVLARITKMKGIDIFLKSFAIAFSQYPHIRAKIGGNGEDLEKCILLSTHLGLESRVQFLGGLDAIEVKEALKESQMVVNASLYETFSIVVSEALCSGKPILCTACGGPEDMCHNKNSIMVPPNDCERMADAMKEMYMNFYQYDSNAIRTQHLQNFGKKALTKRLRTLYKTIVSRMN